MTLPVQTRFNSYTGNGVTTVFAYTFRVFASSDLYVRVNGTLKTLGVDYTVSGVDTVTGGNVTFVTAPANASVIEFESITPLQQTTKYAEGTSFPAVSHEKALDKMVAMLQEMSQTVDTTIYFPVGDTALNELPDKATRIASYLGFDENGEFKVWHPSAEAGITLDASLYMAKALFQAAGDILIGTGAGALTRLPKDTDGKVLSMVAGAPAWATPSGGTSKWTALVPTTDFATTPASTSTATMNADKRGEIKAGMGLKYTIGGTDYFGIVTTMAAGLMTIAGAPLSGTITALSYGLVPPMNISILLDSYWGAAATSQAYRDIYGVPMTWFGQPAYLVAYRIWSRTVDSGGTKERITPTIAGNAVSTANSNNGLEATAATTLYSSVVDINTTSYAITHGQALEFKVQGYGTSKDSTDLVVDLVWVYA